MTRSAPQVSVFATPAPGSGEGSAEPDYQEIWFALERNEWSSVVLVPADAGGSAAAIATALADVGRQLRDNPVTAIVADVLDYNSARVLADLQQHAQQSRRGRVVDIEAVGPSHREDAGQETPPTAPGSPAAAPSHDARMMPPAGQVIVAIQPVVVDPLGVAVARAADAVILCIELERTRLESARRTIDLIGADRIGGAILVRS